MIDRDGMTWLVDFDQAIVGADRGRIAGDERALDATIADLTRPAAAKTSNATPGAASGQTPPRQR